MKRPSPFFPLPEWARNDLEQVRRTLYETLPLPLDGSLDSRKIIFPEEERDPLRPYLVLGTARSFGSSGDRVVCIAAAVQMIHLASILHDRLGTFPPSPDSVDETERGHHQKEAMDILLGDFLFSKASCMIVEDGEQQIVEDVIRTSIASAEAQASLVSLEKDPETFTPARCFDAVSEKFSLLVALALRMGALLGSAPEADRELLSEFGTLFAKALRIVRDLECWTGEGDALRAVSGKSRFSHPLLLLWEQEGREAWEEIARGLGDPAGPDLAQLTSRLESGGYLTGSLDRARECAEEAVRSLERQPGVPGAEDLKALVREHLFHGLAVAGERAS